MSDRSGLRKSSLFGHVIESDFTFTTCLESASGRVDLNISADEVEGDSFVPILADWVPVYLSKEVLEDAQSAVSLYRKNGMYRFRFAGTADFFLRPDSIHCRSVAGRPPEVIELCLLGIVMALWLELKGIPALHASAVVVDCGAVCFCRGSSPGKSTTAMQFLTSGYPLLTDDILPLGIRNGEVFGYPGYPLARIWPKEARHFFKSTQDFRIVHPHYTKLRIPVNDKENLKFSNTQMPVRALYILDKVRNAGRSNIVIEPVSAGESVITLIRNSFVAEMVEASGIQSSRLQTLSEIASQIPVRRIFKPSGHHHLPAVMNAILRDIGCRYER